MPVSLPEPDRTRLANPPLALVACQVTWEGGAFSSKTGLVLQSELKARYREFGQTLSKAMTTSVSMAFGQQGVSATPADSQSGWKIASADGSWAVSIFPDSLGLESQRYESWSGGFRPRFECALLAAAEIVHPEIENRVGLRYFNALSSADASTPLYWLDNRVNPSMIGGFADESLGAAVTSCVQRTVFAISDEISVVLSVAVRPDAVFPGRVAIVFDIDASRQGPREFDATSILAVTSDLNTAALQVFQRFVAPDFLAALRGDSSA